MNDLVVEGATVVVGEVHGTREIPRAFDQLARTATCELIVGLELPRDEPLTSFTTPFWTRDVQDGRSSEAMAELIESLQARGVRIIAFDVDGSETVERDEAMSEPLIAARREHPRAALLVLAGNLHARLVGWSQLPGYVWLAEHLARAIPNVVAINAIHDGGTAWTCNAVGDLGGVKSVLAHGDANDPAYSSRFRVGPVTASPPAISSRSRR